MKLLNTTESSHLVNCGMFNNAVANAVTAANIFLENLLEGDGHYGTYQRNAGR